MCLIASHRDLLSKIIVNKVISEAGAYGLLICKDGEWEQVIVDDLFPCDETGKLIFSQVRQNNWN